MPTATALLEADKLTLDCFRKEEPQRGKYGKSVE